MKELMNEWRINEWMNEEWIILHLAVNEFWIEVIGAWVAPLNTITE